MDEIMFQVFLLLLSLGSAVALVGLWFILAWSRHRRQLLYMRSRPPNTNSAPDTLGSKSEGKGMVTRKCERTGEVFTFFNRTVLSQWYPCHFEVGDEEYNSVMQFVLHQKAIMFEDDKIAKEIRSACNPKELKALDKKMKNIDAKVWDAHCKGIMKIGNMAKFLQNEQLSLDLLSTAGTTIVEASPYDCIWGIGLRPKSPMATDRTTWRGFNWLGDILTDVRDELIQKNAE